MIQLHSAQRLVIGLALVAVPVLGVSSPASAYPNATLVNETHLAATGTIHYAACRRDNFSIPAGHKNANGSITPTQITVSVRRGACLITKIEATLAGAGPAEPYTSSGTGKSDFVIHNSRNNGFVVGAKASLTRLRAVSRI
jgi:hypothetical protein